MACDGEKVGGAIVKVEGDRGELEILFVSPRVHSRGVGYVAWCAIERMYPQVRAWGLVTPYFETRNIHFYVNRCGFHIVEFFNSHHPDPNDPDMVDSRGTGSSRRACSGSRSGCGRVRGCLAAIAPLSMAVLPLFEKAG
ncbi:GNAT family N-acetyltransferase [Olsenella intestinalis]|uniref:GNAT family N-acetyltransferase n=1 Tax=Olsenella intestinalis TaxID=2930083 RepID=UPI003D160AE9